MCGSEALVQRSEAPVILGRWQARHTRDTGFGDVLLTGRGLFGFRDMDDILAAVDAIRSDVEGDSRAAREIAEEELRCGKSDGEESLRR